MSQAINTFVVHDEIEGVYLLKSCEVKLTNATPAKEYFDLVIADKSGEVPGKLWDITRDMKETFKAPMLVKINAVVQTYRDQQQLKVFNIGTLDVWDAYSITDFIKAAPKEPEELLDSISIATGLVKNDDLRTIVFDCLERARERFWTHPAAKGMHHAYYSGLAYHTLRMLQIGQFILGQRPFLNSDLLIAGIILHDIAKTVELEAELGVVKEYSTPGKLIGHISLVSNWIIEVAVAVGIPIDSEEVMLLQHMVLSHHNLGEWGSPVQPQIPEAVALHYIDQLDAKLQAAEDALSAIPVGEKWTQPVPILERKALYRTDLIQPDDDDLPFF